MQNFPIRLSFIMVLFFILPAMGLANNTEPAPNTEKQATPSLQDTESAGTDSTQIDPELLDDDLDFLDEEDEGVPIKVSDPLIGLNRIFFSFNDFFYWKLLRPTALGYKKVVPSPARLSVSNFFRNIAAPMRFVNCVLQGKGAAAEGELAGFFVNSTIGIGGLFNPAARMETPPPEAQDMGLTFGHWGAGPGPYIVLPFLGPSSARDTLGKVGDRFMLPSTYVEPRWAAVSIVGYDTVNDTSFRTQDYDALRTAAIDPYVAMRDAYLQYRLKKVGQ